MERVKAPDDFLEQLHDRMANRPRLKMWANRLFMPFRVKVPIQFAAAVAMAVLVFFMIHRPDVEEEISKMPKLELARNKMKEKGDVERAHIAGQVEEQQREAAPMVSESKEKIAPIKSGHHEMVELRQQAVSKAKSPQPLKASTENLELALFLRPEDFKGSRAANATLDHEMDRPYTSFGKRKTKELPASLTEMADSKRPTYSEERGEAQKDDAIGFSDEDTLEPMAQSPATFLSSEDIIAHIANVVHRVSGTVISLEQDTESAFPKFMDIEIPAEQYEIFHAELQQMGTLQRSKSAYKIVGLDHINIRLLLIVP